MRRRHSLAAAAAILLAVPLSACSAYSGASESSDAAGDRAVSLPAEAVDGSSAAGEAGAGSSPVEPSIVRTGALSVTVPDASAAASDAAEIAADLGGFVETEYVQGEGSGASADVTVRVPADRFEDALERFGGLGEVTSRSTTADDVTASHADLEARVAALETSVQRLTDLMSDSSSTATLIEAEAALSERQQELDSLRAQLEALEQQVDMSTLELRFSVAHALPGGGPTNFWEGLLAGFGSVAAAGSGSLIVLGVVLPWLGVAGAIALVVVLIVRAATRRRRRSRAEDAQPQAPGRAEPEPGGAPQTTTDSVV